jgi:putative resolvase
MKYIKDNYPKHFIISEIGSGMNNNNKGFMKIIDMAIKGKIEELIVTYKDRLCRFGYELIEKIIEKYSKGKIKVLFKEKNRTVEEELVEDILAIMNVYVAKINGIRSHKYRKNK